MQIIQNCVSCGIELPTERFEDGCPLCGYPFQCPWCKGLLKIKAEDAAFYALGENKRFMPSSRDPRVVVVSQTNQKYLNAMERIYRVSADNQIFRPGYPTFQCNLCSKPYILYHRVETMSYSDGIEQRVLTTRCVWLDTCPVCHKVVISFSSPVMKSSKFCFSCKHVLTVTEQGLIQTFEKSQPERAFDDKLRKEKRYKDTSQLIISSIFILFVILNLVFWIAELLR